MWNDLSVAELKQYILDSCGYSCPNHLKLKSEIVKYCTEFFGDEALNQALKKFGKLNTNPGGTAQSRTRNIESSATEGLGHPNDLMSRSSSSRAPEEALPRNSRQAETLKIDEVHAVANPISDSATITPSRRRIRRQKLDPKNDWNVSVSAVDSSASGISNLASRGTARSRSSLAASEAAREEFLSSRRGRRSLVQSRSSEIDANPSVNRMVEMEKLRSEMLHLCQLQPGASKSRVGQKYVSSIDINAKEVSQRDSKTDGDTSRKHSRFTEPACSAPKKNTQVSDMPQGNQVNSGRFEAPSKRSRISAEPLPEILTPSEMLSKPVAVDRTDWNRGQNDSKSARRKSVGSSDGECTASDYAFPDAEKASEDVGSYWPAIDPTGNPVNWRIRDPFVVELSAGRQLPETSPSIRTSKAQSPCQAKVTTTSNGSGSVFAPKIRALTDVKTPKEPTTQLRDWYVRRSREFLRRRSVLWGATLLIVFSIGVFLRTNELSWSLLNSDGLFLNQAVFSFTTRIRRLEDSVKEVGLYLWTAPIGWEYNWNPWNIVRVPVPMAKTIWKRTRRSVSRLYKPKYCDYPSSGDSLEDMPSSSSPNALDCISCPPHSSCKGGAVHCDTPRYHAKMVGFPRRIVCVQDDVAFEGALGKMKQVAQFLAIQQGRYLCGSRSKDLRASVVVPAGVATDDTTSWFPVLDKGSSGLVGSDWARKGAVVAYTACQLREFISMLALQRKKSDTGKEFSEVYDLGTDEAFRVQLAILFEDLLPSERLQQQFGFRIARVARGEAEMPRHYSDQQLQHRENYNTPDPFSCAVDTPYDEATVLVYFSVSAHRSTSCIIRSLVQNYGLHGTGAGILMYALWVLWRAVLVRIYLPKAIERIVEENTSVRMFGTTKPGQARKGYAVGPRASDILRMMKAVNAVFTEVSQKTEVGTDPWLGGNSLCTKSYSEYSWLGKSLSEIHVQAVCEALVQRKGSHVCRSVLSVDMIPFYFSTKAVELQRSAL